jgi:uncharacterized protein YbjT (DUF2867 family)
MTSILVTGGTGTLGRPTVAGLRANGHSVRSLSRRTGPDVVTGDLLSGSGIPESLAGVHTVLHLATKGRTDVAASKTLLAATRAAAVEHLVFVSIVGIEAVPIGFYRDKLAIERLVAESSVPYTILRATQFHSLVEQVFVAQRYSPVILSPAFSMQPIAVEEVAERLVEVAEEGPAGRIADIGGPEQLSGRELARAWAGAAGSRRPIWSIKLPGKAFAALMAGRNMVPGPSYGRRTFAEYLSERYPADR